MLKKILHFRGIQKLVRAANFDLLFTSLIHRNNYTLSISEIVFYMLNPIPLLLLLRNEKVPKLHFSYPLSLKFLNSVSMAVTTFSITLQLH